MNGCSPTDRTGVIKGFNETTDKGLFYRVTSTLSAVFAEPLASTLEKRLKKRERKKKKERT